MAKREWSEISARVAERLRFGRGSWKTIPNPSSKSVPSCPGVYAVVERRRFDWLMVEARLIERLRPMANRRVLRSRGAEAVA